MTERHAPNNHSALAAMFKVGIGEIPTFSNESKWSPEFHSFMASVLVTDPSKRGTAAELYNHPWMKSAETKRGMRTLFQHIFVEKSLETLLV